MNFLAFPSSENAFVSSSLTKAGFLLDTEFWVDFFSFSTLKMLSHCGCHSFWGKIHSHSNNHSPIDNMLFFFGFFQVFSLSLKVCFQKFDYDLCVDFFFQFILLRFTGQLLSFARFGNFSSTVIFSTTFFLHFCWDSNDMHVRPFLPVPQIPEILCKSFLNLF